MCVENHIVDNKVKATLTLITLAPFFGEVLSTSTPFFLFVFPWYYLPLVFLYGFGALIIREYSVRHNRSTLSLMLLAVVYGIIEEGLSLRTFFNPAIVSSAADPERYWGVNTVWVVHILYYHIFFSIWMPVILTHLLFPSVRKEIWVSGKKWWWIGTLYVLINLLYYAIEVYEQPLLPYIATGFAALVLTIIAISLPNVKDPAYLIQSDVSLSAGNMRILVVSLFATMGSFISAWVFPIEDSPLIISLLILLLIPVIAFFLISPSMSSPSYQQLILILWGILLFPLLLFPLIAEPISQSIASIITFGLLLYSQRVWKKMDSADSKADNLS